MNVLEQIKKGLVPFVFTFALSFFLLASIPKVGWMFYQYVANLDPFYHVGFVSSYGMAVTIDALAAFLVWVTTTRGYTWQMAWGVWLFVALLSGYSIILNWFYDMLHAPGADVAIVWHYQIVPAWSIEQITNLLVSAAPGWLLGWMLVARPIRLDMHAETIEELEVRADKAERKQKAQSRITVASANTRDTWIAGVVKSAKHARKAWVENEQSAVGGPGQDGAITPAQDSQSTPSAPAKSPSLALLKRPPEDSPLDEQTALVVMLERYPKMADIYTSYLAGEKKSVGIEVAVNATGLTEKQVRNRLANKTITRTPNNPELITIKSLIDWWKDAWTTEDKKQQSDKMKVVNLPAPMPSNGAHDPTQERE